jgi:hypothetical protein
MASPEQRTAERRPVANHLLSLRDVVRLWIVSLVAGWPQISADDGHHEHGDRSCEQNDFDQTSSIPSIEPMRSSLVPTPASPCQFPHPKEELGVATGVLSLEGEPQ